MTQTKDQWDPWDALAIMGEPDDADEQEEAVACPRVKLSRSPRWCRVHFRRLLRHLAPSGVCLLIIAVNIRYYDSPWLRGVPSLPAFLCFLFILLLTIGGATFDRLLDLPPLEWRRHARKEWVLPRYSGSHVYNHELGDDEYVSLLKCPGCGKQTDYPSQRDRFRCGIVEYEVRGFHIWLAPAQAASSAAGLQSRVRVETAPDRVLQ